MILADKIIEERKKNGWSQEELADRMGVSRQAVSRWESAGAVPDLQKILMMADLFGVSTDYLLRDDMEPEHSVPAAVAGAAEIRTVSMEEADAFLINKRKCAVSVANAVAMCILSPVLLVVLGTMAEDRVFGITEKLTASAGCTFLFCMIAAAVFVFIICGLRDSSAERLEKNCFETAYGVAGKVRALRDEFESTFIRGIAVGSVLCILSVVPLVIAASLEAPEYVIGLFTGLLLVMIAVGVDMIVRAVIIRGSYDTLLQEGEYSRDNKQMSGRVDAVSSIYWCLVTAVYLGWSFWTMRWDFTWIIWPVTGVLYAVVENIVRLLSARQQD